jgi:methionyl-tRNA formyltransferase
MRLIFAGTPAFAQQALADLHAAGHEIVLVMTQPDRPAGRGMKLQASPVKQWALEHGLPVSQPQGLKLDGRFADDAKQAQALIAAAQADVMVVAAYGLILPQWVLSAPRLGCLNIHASLLPRWRGAAPIHRAIEAGDTSTGITIMQMDAGLDTGHMLLKAELPIGPQATTASLHDELAALGGQLIVQALVQAHAGTLGTGTAQAAEGVTYAHKIEKSESAIDWRLPAVEIERRIRAFDPFPGCTLRWGEDDKTAEVIKVWSATVVPCPAAELCPGSVVLNHSQPGHDLVVACGTDALAITLVQRPGGRRIDAKTLVANMDLNSLPLSSSETAQQRLSQGVVSRLA